MPNIFPANGNAGIGTTTPPEALTILGSTMPPLPVKLRIDGISPVVACGPDGADIIMGRVTGSTQFYSFSAIGDTFLFHQSDAPGVRTFLGRSLSRTPLITLHNDQNRTVIGHEDSLRSDDKSTLFVGRTQGNVDIVMADFSFKSPASSGDSGCARFVARASGQASVRALEAHAIRDPIAGTTAKTWALEVGVHTRTGTPPSSVRDRTIGAYFATNPVDWVAAETGERVDCAIFVEAGDPGWHYAIRYRQTDLDVDRFAVDHFGNVTTNGSIVVKNSVTAEVSFHSNGFMRATAAMYATAFVTEPSSRDAKENIVNLEAEEAGRLLDALTPARYALKSQPDVTRLGFIADELPQPLSPDGRGVSLSDVIATLTRVLQDQRAAIRTQQTVIEQQQTAIDRLRQDLDARVPPPGVQPTP